MTILKKLTAACCVLLMLAVCCACGNGPAPASSHLATATGAVDLSDAEKLGEGAHQFWFTVTFADGSTKAYDIATDETTVGAALKALGLVDGVEGDYGLYVKEIGGQRADYNKDRVYWAFYIDGEYAMTGVDSTEIADGSVYAFVCTSADQFN